MQNNTKIVYLAGNAYAPSVFLGALTTSNNDKVNNNRKNINNPEENKCACGSDKVIVINGKNMNLYSI